MNWEYRYAEILVGVGFPDALNGYGKEGWELLHCSQGRADNGLTFWLCIFKRRALDIDLTLPRDGRR